MREARGRGKLVVKHGEAVRGREERALGAGNGVEF